MGKKCWVNLSKRVCVYSVDKKHASQSLTLTSWLLNTIYQLDPTCTDTCQRDRKYKKKHFKMKFIMHKIIHASI